MDSFRLASVWAASLAWVLLFGAAEAGAQTTTEKVGAPVTPSNSAPPPPPPPPAPPAHPQPPPAAPARAAAPAPTAVPDADPAWKLYHEAFRALAGRNEGRAVQLLTRLLNQYPGHPAAERGQWLLVDLQSPREASSEAHQRLGTPPATAPGPVAAASTKGARAELASFQTLHGLVLGIESCTLLECDGERAWALGLMATTGAGLGLSLRLSANGITPGQARALTSGVYWGAWNGFLLGMATDAIESARDEGKATATSLMLGQLAGLAGGALLHNLYRPAAGDVSLAMSGGIWSTALAALGILFLQPAIEDQSGAFWTWFVTGNLGSLGGALLADRVPMSAGRVLMLDAAGIVGLLLGAGGAILLEGEASARGVGGLGIVGTVAGLGAGYYFTQTWDTGGGDTSPLLSVLPVPGGAVGSIRGRF
ncbi:MAG: hypothetical protein MJD61_17105 [Proteobacteria bacterium]|nr:hypothetical protein [Pseudomonadota bacterium]